MIRIPGGYKFYDTVQRLVAIIRGLNPDFGYAEHPKFESFLKRLFAPTVGKYLRDSGNNVRLRDRINQIDGITPKTKVGSLAGFQRRLLSVCRTLTFTKNIIVDLAGVDPGGGTEIFALLRNNAKKKGAVILVDHCDEFKDSCSKFIVAERIAD